MTPLNADNYFIYGNTQGIQLGRLADMQGEVVIYDSAADKASLLGAWRDVLPAQKCVECVQSGVVYDSAADACRTLDIPASRMSLHLNGKPGYKTIKGLTFRYTA